MQEFIKLTKKSSWKQVGSGPHHHFSPQTRQLSPEGRGQPEFSTHSSGVKTQQSWSTLNPGTCKASVQFTHSVVCNSLGPHELQHTRPPCVSPAPRVYSDSCPSSQWCHPTISSSVVPFSSRLQSLPASESFQMSQLFTWGGQSIGVSASASVLPMNTQDWSPLGWTGWISLQSRVQNLQHYSSKASILRHSAPFIV